MIVSLVRVESRQKQNQWSAQIRERASITTHLSNHLGEVVSCRTDAGNRGDPAQHISYGKHFIHIALLSLPPLTHSIGEVTRRIGRSHCASSAHVDTWPDMKPDTVQRARVVKIKPESADSIIETQL